MDLLKDTQSRLKVGWQVKTKHPTTNKWVKAVIVSIDENGVHLATSSYNFVFCIALDELHLNTDSSKVKLS